MIDASYTIRSNEVSSRHTALNGDMRILEIVAGPDANGVYTARVEIRAPDGSWIEKTSKGGVNSMFPRDWDAQRVQAEIESAWERKSPTQGKASMWTGTSDSGVKIEGYLYPRTTAFPVRESQ